MMDWWVSVGKMAPRVSDSKRVRAKDAVFGCMCVHMCPCLVVCMPYFVTNEHMWVWEQESVTDISLFCVFSIIRAPGFYVTQNVRCCVKQILSKKVCSVSILTKISN